MFKPGKPFIVDSDIIYTYFLGFSKSLYGRIEYVTIFSTLLEEIRGRILTSRKVAPPLSMSKI